MYPPSHGPSYLENLTAPHKSDTSCKKVAVNQYSRYFFLFPPFTYIYFDFSLQKLGTIVNEIDFASLNFILKFCS